MGDHGLRSNSLVSIVIVAYNNWPDLELAIQSALNQSYKQIEVIVVDNSSIDETARLVPEVFGNRVRYVRQPNTGEGGGRNTGFRLSEGEFIQFLDGDDLLAPDKVEKQLTMLEGEPDVDVVYGDVRQFQTDAGPASWKDWDTQDYPDMLATLLSSQGNGAGLLPDSVMFRRRALEFVGLWTESSPGPEGNTGAYIGSDQDYWLRAAWSGCLFKYCPGSLSIRRRHSGQLSSNVRACVRGMEPVLVRARKYITQEPYRTMVLERLSRLLFYLAVSERDASTEESLGRLRTAREANPSFITPPVFVIGRLLIITGIGPFLFGRWLKPVRQLSSRLVGMKRGC